MKNTLYLCRFLDRQALTFCLDGGGVDGEVGVPGQVSRPDHVLTEAASHSRQAGCLQVEGLPRLNGKLGAAAMPQRQTVGTLQEQTAGCFHTAGGRI